MALPERLSQIFERVRGDLDFALFLSALQHNNVAYYIYYLPTGNIQFVTNTDAVISMKSNRDLLVVNTKTHLAKIKLAAKKHFAGESGYDEFCIALAEAGVFKWVTDLHDKKRRYWSVDNVLLYVDDITCPENTL
ncbi:TPA: DUF1398 domain-containing protein [Raoultella planticola]|nr:DUF1398 domain-containing protein [Raoultella planticola]